MPFQELIEEAGCRLDSDTVVFVVEPVLFRRALGMKLRSQTNGFEEFSQDLQRFTEDPAVFRKFLLPSTLADNVPKTSRTSTSESLFKTLLAIDSIQPDIINYLLERLPEFYEELESDNSSSCTARLILHQLRWLDYIAQPEDLTGKLIEIIQITPPLIQHELITSLPDIVNDSEHKTQPIVVYLKELMNDNPDLTVPILDALSNLTLHSESLEDVRETVLDRLESAELDDLAVIIKFILQTVTPTTIDLVVYGIRQKLDFRALGKLHQTSAAATQRSNAKEAPEALILESIKLGLQFHKFVCDSWLKSIVALESQREHKVIDMLVLIILYSMTSMKKKIEAIIKKKIIQGSITSALIQETIMCHADGLVGYWSSLLSLSESLLRSCQQNSAISPSASISYISSFKSSDSYYRQEIIGALATHIGSGVEAEMNVALNVLLRLVKSSVSSVAVYSVFVKGILDYLDNLNLYQIRTLFDIFSLLAITSDNANDGSGNLWDEIQIVIRKQLSNPREKYKKIGIIATISAVKVLGNRKLCTEQSNVGSSSLAHRQSQANNVHRHPYLRQATSSLGTMLRFTNDNPNCVAMVYDELAHMVTEEDIDERLLGWIRENMASDFTEYYVVALADGDEFIQKHQNDPYRKLEPEKQMNMDGAQSAILVRMYNIMCSTDIKQKLFYIVPMCSIFNLIQSSEKKLTQGSLEEVDALFGCGIIMFKTDDPDDITTEEAGYACDILFYTINWFKELLNAFMFVKEEENYRERLITRIGHILEMENVLGELMKQAPKYAPLEFHTAGPVTSAARVDASQTMSIPGSNESQKSQESNHSQATIGHKAAAKKDHKSNSIAFASVDDLRPYMRPFYVHILEILKYNGELEDTDNKMTYEEINYILEDLNHKLDIKIVPPPPLAFGRKKATAEDKHPSSNGTLLARIDSQNFMKKVVAYLPHILQTFEDTYVDIQSRDIEPGRTENHKDIAHSLSLMFNVIYKIFSWPDIQNSDNVAILQEIIHCISQRISGDGKQKNRSSPETELAQAFQYLSQYGDNIPESKTTVLLFKILQRLMVIFENPAPLRRTALKVVHQIVTTDWFDSLEIKKDIPYLIEEWIALSDDPLDVIDKFIDKVLPQYDEEGKLDDYPLLNSKTLLPYYQAVVSQTVKAFSLLKETDQEEGLVLVQTARIVRIFDRITRYVKAKEDKMLIGVLLKTGRLFIDQFLKHSIPFFTKVFKAHTSDIIGIFKDFQTSTRALQVICSHVKVLKEVMLSQYVPPLKRDLETVIYQVKMLLTENRVSLNAFSTGALKHRDIRGAEVSSQIPREEYDDDDDKYTNEMEVDNSEEEEAEEDADNIRVQKKKKTTKKAPATIKKATTSTKPRSKSKLSNSVTAKQYRTSSLVPSSADEEEEEEEMPMIEEEAQEGDEEEEEEVDELSEDEPAVINATKNKRKVETMTDEQEDMVDIFPGSSDEEDEEEQSNGMVIDEAEEDQDDDDVPPIIPLPPPPPPKRKEKEQPTKKRRLGIGSFRSSQKKKFNLTGSK